MMQIRNAAEADLDQITAIYNEVLTNSTAIYNDRPATTEERIAWWKGRVQQRYPVLVAADGDRIAGFATFGDFRSGPAIDSQLKEPCTSVPTRVARAWERIC